MPSQDAWGLALQFLPAYLTSPTKTPWPPGQRRREARDLLAVVLTQKPHSPEAHHAHSEAKLLLLRRALWFAQVIGRSLLDSRRLSVTNDLDRDSAANFALNMQRPRNLGLSHGALDYPAVFWANWALGETEERAQREAGYTQERLARKFSRTEDWEWYDSD